MTTAHTIFITRIYFKLFLKAAINMGKVLEIEQQISKDSKDINSNYRGQRQGSG